MTEDEAPPLFTAAVRRRLAASRAAIVWERLWRRLWPLVSLAVAFVALSGLGLFLLLPAWAHLVVLALFAAGSVWALARLGRFRWPRWDEAVRRLERDGGAVHRPLAALLDRPATPDHAAAAIWHAHRARQEAAAERLRPRLPRPGIAAQDRFAVRGLVVLGLVVALALSGGELASRVGAALSPRLAFGGPQAPATVDLYVTPPAYTRQPPLYLSAAAAAAPDAPLRVPAGSIVTAHGSGIGGAVLEIDGTETPFAEDGSVEAEIVSGRAITVRDGGSVIATWPVLVVPDLPPTVAFAKPPTTTERQSLRIDWLATDDWGVDTLSVAFSLLPGAPQGLDPTPFVIALPAPKPAAARAQGSRFEDLTPNAWAGQRVSVVLTATDEIGQIGRSDPVELVLPEREFHHPVARAIVGIRKLVTEQPAAARDGAQALDALSVRPGTYADDRIVFLALRIAARRLAASADAVRADLAGIRDLLWQTALRVEDGGLSQAQAAMREAAQALQDAIDAGADEAEIARLTDALRQAMAQMLQEMQRAIQEGRMPAPQELPPGAQATPMDPQALDRMMQRLQEMAQGGDREAAQELLSQMQQMMENLTTAQPSAEQMAAQQEAMDIMRDMQGLIQAERALRDRTFRGSGDAGEDETAQGTEPGGGTPSAAEQEAIRKQLGELMRRMGELTGDIPEPFGEAEQAMRDAEDALGSPWPGDAVDPQGQALDALGRGMQGLSESMQGQGMPGQGTGVAGRPQERRPGPGPDGSDPLGRPNGDVGGMSDDDVGIPTRPDMQRARDILDELRRRLGDRDRPSTELDYLRRLMDRF